MPTTGAASDAGERLRGVAPAEREKVSGSAGMVTRRGGETDEDAILDDILNSYFWRS